jgi:hypothetical protein
MMAEVIPYPLAHRVGFIRKQADWLAGQTPRGAEQNLRHQLDKQAAALRAKGVPEATIRREVGELGAAIRAAMVRRSGFGGAA